MTAADHSGFDDRGRELITVKDGNWTQVNRPPRSAFGASLRGMPTDRQSLRGIPMGHRFLGTRVACLRALSYPEFCMNAQIALILGQDGITNGAIYALLALSILLVFTVTRVLFIPQGEFVAFGALTMASLQAASRWRWCGCCWPSRWPKPSVTCWPGAATGAHARLAHRRQGGLPLILAALLYRLPLAQLPMAVQRC